MTIVCFICIIATVMKTQPNIGDWSNGMIGVSKTFGGSSILSSPAINKCRRFLYFKGFRHFLFLSFLAGNQKSNRPDCNINVQAITFQYFNFCLFHCQIKTSYPVLDFFFRNTGRKSFTFLPVSGSCHFLQKLSAVTKPGGC